MMVAALELVFSAAIFLHNNTDLLHNSEEQKTEFHLLLQPINR